jgi:hypothetical protein
MLMLNKLKVLGSGTGEGEKVMESNVKPGSKEGGMIGGTQLVILSVSTWPAKEDISPANTM